jgi:hypothetical protein
MRYYQGTFMLRFTGAALFVITFGTAAFAQPNPPMDSGARVRWLVRQNLAPVSLLENVAIGAFTTWTNTPEEYGPHWDGFAKRTGAVTANYGILTTMEAGLGAMWGEDPRYERVGDGKPFKNRFGNVVRMTFIAKTKSGGTMPAYARFISMGGTAFLGNAWLPDSQSSTGDAVSRAFSSLGNRALANLVKEFSPKLW